MRYLQIVFVVIAFGWIRLTGLAENARGIASGVTGRLKTGHLWALQNRPLQGVLFISDFLTQARFFSIS
jgi:hypothetical protein